MSAEFARPYSANGRPSIAPENLRALLLQVLYTVRCERLLIEQLDYNPLFRWFVGLNMDIQPRGTSVRQPERYFKAMSVIKLAETNQRVTTISTTVQ